MIGLISWLWSCASWLSFWLCRFRKPQHLGPRVIGVGNLQAGGTGKTPLVAFLAREASQRGCRVGILLRGYRSPSEFQNEVLLPGQVPSEHCSDEARLLQRLCPEATLGIGADRIGSFELMKKHGPWDLIILDDAFQYHKIHQDIRILTLTSWKPSEKIFRDFFGASKRADLLVWTKGEIPPERAYIKVRYRIPPPAQGVGFLLVTGIGDPQEAWKLLNASGYQVKRHCIFKDHHEYTQVQVGSLLNQASAMQCQVVLTGKDWVKWELLGVKRSEVLVLEPELIFEGGYELWSEVLWGK